MTNAEAGAIAAVVGLLTFFVLLYPTVRLYHYLDTKRLGGFYATFRRAATKIVNAYETIGRPAKVDPADPPGRAAHRARLTPRRCIRRLRSRPAPGGRHLLTLAA